MSLIVESLAKRFGNYPVLEGVSFTGPYAAYFTELMQRQQGEKYFIGLPTDILQGQCKDTFVQVMNSGFPGGLLTVDQAVKMMDDGCPKS